ncbi:MAG: cytochrome-c oxidase, cbb3-type subunit I, partial [Novosphingobium sp.]
MWRTYNDSGTLNYSFLDTVEAMHPYYIARAIGGLLFLIGAVIGCWNIWKTITMPSPEVVNADVPLLPNLQPAE